MMSQKKPFYFPPSITIQCWKKILHTTNLCTKLIQHGDRVGGDREKTSQKKTLKTKRWKKSTVKNQQEKKTSSGVDSKKWIHNLHITFTISKKWSEIFLPCKLLFFRQEHFDNSRKTSCIFNAQEKMLVFSYDEFFEVLWLSLKNTFSLKTRRLSSQILLIFLQQLHLAWVKNIAYFSWNNVRNSFLIVIGCCCMPFSFLFLLTMCLCTKLKRKTIDPLWINFDDQFEWSMLNGVETLQKHCAEMHFSEKRENVNKQVEMRQRSSFPLSFGSCRWFTWGKYPHHQGRCWAWWQCCQGAGGNPPGSLHGLRKQTQDWDYLLLWGIVWCAIPNSG